MKASIMGGQWEMELPPQDDDNTNSWFLDWVMKAPKQAGKHLACGFSAIESLLDIYTADDIQVAWEPFGGIGAQALMVEYCFNVKNDHLVCDIAEPAVKHLNKVLPITVNIEQNDAYSGEIYEADIALLDFGDLTVWKAQPGKPQGDLLARVFNSNHKAIVVTDIASRYLHLQKKSYEPLLGEGTCETYEEYLRAFSLHLQARYGYGLHQAYYTHWSGVMAFVPEALLDPLESGRITKLPEDTIGLTLG